jgi:hypothetical protein
MRRLFNLLHGTDVSFYRLYFMMGADRIARAEDLPAIDDADAMSLACERLTASGYSHGELWQRARLLSGLCLEKGAHVCSCAR